MSRTSKLDEENTYKDREIDRMFNQIKEALERIEAQTTRTNGRVTSLERWRWALAVGVGVLVATSSGTSALEALAKVIGMS